MDMKLLKTVLLALLCTLLIGYKVAMPFTPAWVDIALLCLSILVLLLIYALPNSAKNSMPPSESDGSGP